MAKPSFRYQQLIVSVIGLIIILPLDTFLGAMFVFSLSARDSLWVVAFDLIAFWSQIPGIIVSFFKPRLGAGWMLVNIGISVVIGIISEVNSAYAPDALHLTISGWIKDVPVMLKEATFFWGIPMIFALLLLRKEPSARRESTTSVESHGDN